MHDFFDYVIRHQLPFTFTFSSGFGLSLNLNRTLLNLNQGFSSGFRKFPEPNRWSSSGFGQYRPWTELNRTFSSLDCKDTVENGCHCSVPNTCVIACTRLVHSYLFHTAIKLRSYIANFKYNIINRHRYLRGRAWGRSLELENSFLQCPVLLGLRRGVSAPIPRRNVHRTVNCPVACGWGRDIFIGWCAVAPRVHRTGPNISEQKAILHFVWHENQEWGLNIVRQKSDHKMKLKCYLLFWFWNIPCGNKKLSFFQNV